MVPPPNPEPLPTFRSRIRALCDEPELNYRDHLNEPKGDEMKQEGECAWWTMCPNLATTTRSHPTLGDVPICGMCDIRAEAIERGVSQNTVIWERAARKLGKHAAEAAASWIVDGNAKREVAERVLKLMDDGDPLMEQYMPSRPNLSGEWADDPTPDSVIEEVTGKQATYVKDVDREAIINAWEQGVDENFEVACEAELRKVVA